MKKTTVAAIQYTEAVLAGLLIRFFLRPSSINAHNVTIALDLAAAHGCSIVIIANHVNAYDPIYLSTALCSKAGKKLYPVWLPAKKRFFDSLLKNKFMRVHGCLPLGIGKDEDSLRSMKDIIEKVRTGDNICIFPEGQVSRDGTLGKDMGFVTFLARRNRLVVLPVHLSGIAGFKTEWKQILCRKRRLQISFGEPILLEKGTDIECMSLILSAENK